MPWTEITRKQYARRGGRYASDATDAEWALIAPFIPPARLMGRPRSTDMRAVFDAILYIAATGCQWAMLPTDFPPRSTVQRYFYAWRDDGLFVRISNVLVMRARDGGPRGQPDGGRDRQPEREGH